MYKLGETSEIVCSFPFLAWSIQWVEENSQEVVVKKAYDVQELTLDLTLSTSHSNFSYNCSYVCVVTALEAEEYVSDTVNIELERTLNSLHGAVCR